MLEATSNYQAPQPEEKVGQKCWYSPTGLQYESNAMKKSLLFVKIGLSVFAYAAFAVASPYNIRAMLPRLSRAPVG
jgi:hypothetical protein